MAIRLQPVDVVLVGMGFTGAILARELAEEGLSVVGLERGVARDTVPDWQSPAMHDELRYSIRNELFQNMAIEPFTFRNHAGEQASVKPAGGKLMWRFSVNDIAITSNGGPTSASSAHPRERVQNGAPDSDRRASAASGDVRGP